MTLTLHPKSDLRMVQVVNRDVSEQLHKRVGSILEEHDLEVLSDYWDLGRGVFAGQPIGRFYVQVEEGFGNIAILAGGVVVDIVGNEQDGEGSVAVHRVNAFSGIDFYEEHVPTVPGSEEAELVVVTSIAGADELGPYWMATTEEEAGHLLEFGRALVTILAGNRD